MKKIDLPKWAVVNGLGNTRLIHLGNGVFLSADTQTPKMFESCVPVDEASNTPTGVEAVDAPEYLLQWQLGQFQVTTEEPVPAPTSLADALNAETNPAEEPAAPTE